MNEMAPLATDTATARKLSLAVTGMSCSGCATRIERKLKAAPGVEDAAVNFALEQAEVRYRPGETAPDKLVELLRDTGFGVRQATTTLAIDGMSCASCVGRVEKALAKQPGVLSASVNLALGQAEVRHLAEAVDAEALAEASAAAGYPAHPLGEAGADEEVEAAERAAARRDRLELTVAIVLTLPLVAQMVSMVLGLGWHLPTWLEVTLATPIQFWIGRRFYRGAWKATKAGAGSMDQLVALGTSAAYAYSLFLVVTRGEAAAGHLYFEASAVVITLVLAGKVLEARAKRAAAAALKSLMALRPQEARVLAGGREVMRPIGEVAVGDLVVVKPGERLPVDGRIADGESELDESLITGESLPVARHAGEEVVAGALNGSGLLKIETLRVGRDTTLAKIAALVAAAQAGKAPIQRLVDRIAGIFVPVVLVIAALTLVAWLAYGAGFEAALMASVAVLVIACPCALGLATPTALVAGTGAAASAGILIRDIEALERAQAIDTVIFDKTGTLTEGAPKLTELVAVEGDEEALLRLAASAQRGSEHPLGKALVAEAEARGLTLAEPKGFAAKVGEGISAKVEEAEVKIGRRRFALVEGDGEALAEAARRLEGEGKTVVWIARDGKAQGLAALADRPRAGAGEAVARLKQRGIRVLLLSGDNRATAERVGAALGIDEVIAEVRPEDKAATVERLRTEGRRVAMVGDGLNDAPALAAADVGIAMGGGAEAALETAGVALMRPDPRLVSAALEIARKTSSKIHQNLFWAFFYNVVGIPIAALGLLNPAVAGAAMAASSVSVVSNALLLKRWRPKGEVA